MHLSMYICSMCGERGVHVGGLLEEEHIYLWMLAPSQLDPDSIRIVFSPAHRIFAIAYGIWPALTVYVYPGLTVMLPRRALRSNAWRWRDDQAYPLAKRKSFEVHTETVRTYPLICVAALMLFLF